MIPTKLRSRGPVFPAAPIIQVAERVTELRRQNIDIISMGMGESDHGTPPHVRAAARDAIERDTLACTSPPGSLDLRKGIAAWLEVEYGQRFSTDEVLVSVGSKFALNALFLTMLDPGDEVIIPVPAWPTIGSLVEARGARAVYVPCDTKDGFRPHLARLTAAVTERTRAVYIANPGNPTGAVLPAAVLEPIARLCADRGLTLINDGAYRSHCYEGVVPNLYQIATAHGAACVIVETVSKRYSMSSWRIGFIAAHRDLVAAMADVQAQTFTCPPAITQIAALAALSGPQDHVTTSIAEFAQRRLLLLARLDEIPGLVLHTKPTGAFFAFPDVSALMGSRTAAGVTIDTDMALVHYLLDEAHVATTPGSMFGAPGHIRMSYTLPAPRIAEACTRIGSALAKLTLA